jgi:signal transduction histidine kinase
MLLKIFFIRRKTDYPFFQKRQPQKNRTISFVATLRWFRISASIWVGLPETGGRQKRCLIMSPESSTKKTSGLPQEPSTGGKPAYEENLQRLDRLAGLGLLAAGMAHEIKNGMVAVRTFVELLLQKGEDKELNEVVTRELKRIDELVSQMLRMTSPSPANFTTLRAHDALDHSLRLVAHQINGKMISLKKNYAAESDVVRGDDAQLQQVFMNLFFNAIEAMGTNGTLTVSTENVAAENGARVLMIKIQDTGVGIAPENLGRLFEPFFTTKKNGTGLGLTISQRIIRDHHGVIRAQSEVNKGSTFSISLPSV